MKRLLIIYLVITSLYLSYESSLNDISNLNLEELLLKEFALESGITETAKNLWNDLLTWLSGIKKYVVEGWKNGGETLALQVCIENLQKKEGRNNEIMCGAIIKLIGWAINKMS